MAEYIRLNEYPNIAMDVRCEKELRAVLQGYGDGKKFQIWLATQLSNLNDTSINCVDAYPKCFERLKHTPGLYAITYRRQKKNIRVIYTLHQGAFHILLCTFDEKNTRVDYPIYVSKAIDRKNEIPTKGLF